MPVAETTIAAFLDRIGWRGVCKVCHEPVWYVWNRKAPDRPIAFTVQLQEHKHDGPKQQPIKKMIEAEKRAPGGSVGFKNYF